MTRTSRFAGFFLVAVLASPAAAEAPRTDPGKAADPVIAWTVEGFASGVGGMIHRDAAFGFDLGIGAQVAAFRGLLAAPVRFDRKGLRRADWDERTDFGRIVSELAWQGPGDPWWLRLAPVEGLTLGTGNLVSDFVSTIDPDHWRTGFVGALDFRPVAAQVFLDSFLDPQVLGGRVAIRPFYWVDDRGIFGRLEVGMALAGDLRMPWDPCPGPPDATGIPASGREGLLAGSIDLRWTLWRSRTVEVTPHGAWTRLGVSDAAHAGLTLALAPHQNVRLRLGGEWRWLGPRAVLPWFDGLYMADRHVFLDQPKGRARDLASDGRHGSAVHFGLEWRPWLDLGGEFHHDPRWDFATVSASLAVQWPDHLRIAATLRARGLGHPRRGPDRLLAAVSADATLWKSIALFGVYARDLAGCTAPDGSGSLCPSDSFLLGLRLAICHEAPATKPREDLKSTQTGQDRR